MTKDTTNSTYDFHLPVFKQGDDLHHHIQRNPGAPEKALLGLAEQYEEASRLCRRVAAVVAETPGVELFADTHMIQVTGPTAALTGLVADEVLTATPFDDEGDEDEDEVLDEDGDDETI